jgi:hypothetical protein
MNPGPSFERLVADHVAGAAGGIRLPDDFYDDIHAHASRTRQRPEWLALIKELPMHTSSGLAVGSPTIRVATTLVATLLAALMIAGAAFAGAQLLAADGTIVVDQNDPLAVQTISEAVAMAEDGDTILVRPGIYVEAVIVGKDIMLRGDGPRDDIVIMAPENGPTAVIATEATYSEEDPYAILLQDTTATLSGLTFRGEPAEIIAAGGAPVLEDLLFDATGFPYDGSTTSARGSSIVINGGSTATVQRNTLTGGGPIGVFDMSEPLISGNTLIGGPHIWGDYGDGAVIRDNTIEGALQRAIGLFAPTSPTIAGNTITDPGTVGIDVWAGSPTIEGNTISGAPRAAVAVGGGEPTITNNQLLDNAMAISWSGTPAGLIGDNTVSGGRVGIFIGAGSPAVRDNTVTGVEGRGITVGFGASPTLTGNRSCDNGENLTVAEGAEPVMEDNDICPPGSAEAIE